jgi:hypothetical protein
MSSPRAHGVIHNKHWPEIIDRLLDGSDAERDEARDTLWVEVQRYVLRFAQLPIGPLADDVEVRANVALKVLDRLERAGYREVRHWRERQRRVPKGPPWWGMVGTIAYQRAIDVARVSKLRLVADRKRFEWAREVPLEPEILDNARKETLRRSFDFLENATREEIDVFVDKLNDTLTDGDRRGRNGESTAQRLGLPRKHDDDDDGGPKR